MIQEVADDAQAETALRFMVNSAHAKNIKIIASSVDDASMLPAVWQCQVDLIQGQFVGARSASTEHAYTAKIQLEGGKTERAEVAEPSEGA